MPRLSTRRTVLLDGAAAVGLSGPALMVLYGIDSRPPVLTIVVGAVVLASIGVWILWRRVPRFERASAIVFALCGLGCLLGGDGPLAFGAAWVACVVLARTFGPLAALGYTALLCATVAGIHLSIGSSAERVLVETVGTAVLAGFGAAFAIVLHDGERVEREREILAAQREATLAELARAHAELQRRLGSEQDLVLAEERARTARELHDGLGHRLTAVGLSLEFAERTRERDPERAWTEVGVARTRVSESLDSMRRVVRAMHPVELGAARGTEAFAAIADAFRTTGLDIRVTVDGSSPLTPEQSLLLVRFTQEGLTNVVRHADPRRVELLVRADDDGVEVSIEDAGRIGELPAFEGEGFGLRSLRVRAESLGGGLEARPRAAGFVVRMWLPAPVLDSPALGAPAFDARVLDAPAVRGRRTDAA